MKLVAKEFFKNKTNCTLDEYEKFLDSYSKEYSKSDTIYIFYYIIFFSGCALLGIIYKEYLLSGILILGLMIYIWYKFFRPANIVKKDIKSEKLKHGMINTYIFYKYYFTVNSQDGNSKTNYVNLYKVVETKTNFYIYITRETAFILSKSGFTKGTSIEFTDFIKKKVGFKYKKRF